MENSLKNRPKVFEKVFLRILNKPGLRNKYSLHSVEESMSPGRCSIFHCQRKLKHIKAHMDSTEEDVEDGGQEMFEKGHYLLRRIN